MNPALKPRASQAGIALLGVLWVLALLTLAAAGLAASARSDLRLAANLLAAATARHAAEAGAQLGLYELAAGEAGQRWLPDGSVHELAFGSADVRIMLADEAGYIDLNSAPPAVLEGLLAGAGVEEAERRQIVDAILDWRDADDDARSGGSEQAQYRAAGTTYAPRNGPFQTVEELQLVLGVTPTLFSALAIALTVHSRQPGILAESASRQVLLAIPGAVAAEIDAYLALRAHSRDAGREPPAPPEALRPHVTRNGSATLRIHSQSRLPGGAQAHLTTTVDMRRPGLDAPFTFRSWRRDGPDLF